MVILEIFSKYYYLYYSLIICKLICLPTLHSDKQGIYLRYSPKNPLVISKHKLIFNICICIII